MWAFRTSDARPDDFPIMLAALRVAGGLTKRSAVQAGRAVSARRARVLGRWYLGGRRGGV